jgi:asparagine synthetase B (glutamine-hydrolysing)
VNRRRDEGTSGETLVYESDWLASRPLFYNVRTGRASHLINDVIDLAEVEFDPEGLNDYLDFGYSVFERTPLRDVRMLRFSARLYSGPNGLRVEYLDDPAWPWLEERSTVDEVLELARAKVNEAAAGEGPGVDPGGAGGDGDDPLVVPTSGGFDSRLINMLLADRRPVRAVTFGVSDDPARSTEAIKAAELARRLGLRWDLVPLGGFHRYFDAWDDLFGVATHAHGMYQIEFYRRVRERVAAHGRVLSGACGERFAGVDRVVRSIPTLRGLDDAYTVFRYPNMSADSRGSVLRGRREGMTRLLETTPRLRTEVLPRVVTVTRLRMVLLSYLLSVPASLGFQARAPLLDIELAMRMLTLPLEQRRDRRWQREFFAREGVDLETDVPGGDWRNTLNFTAMRRVPVRPLDVALLREVVRPDYVRWINRYVRAFGLTSEALWRLGTVHGFRRAVSALEPTGVVDRRELAYNAYLTLRPIEALLRRRDLARRGDDPAG